MDLTDVNDAMSRLSWSIDPKSFPRASFPGFPAIRSAQVEWQTVADESTVAEYLWRAGANRVETAAFAQWHNPEQDCAGQSTRGFSVAVGLLLTYPEGF